VQEQDIVIKGPAVYRSDALPGSNKATLTLSDGKKIGLDTAHNGLLAREGNTKVLQSGNGQLNYQAAETSFGGKEIAYNILSTPRGGQYRLVLPDGSRVWLNAASSIRYPTVFDRRERKVEVSGEAYFEVITNAAMPFRVTGKGVTVEVLGTSFNVNLYDDEPLMMTTLSEGKVKVTGDRNSQLLAPGEQAQWSPGGEIKLEKDIDMEKTMAWKNNQFIFERDDLPAILRQLGRWYDVEIRYQDSPKPYHFSGIISRARNASDVLRMLEATGNIHFDIEGKKIIVKP
jgi:ferric-dicitrate binding protein FerR (iron transport regulator)